MSVTEDKRGKSALDVFMKARNLLDYTLTITANPKVFRPDLERKHKKVTEILKVGNNENEIIKRLVDMLDMCVDPVENTYTWLIRVIRNSANDMFIKAWKANNIRVGNNPEYKTMRLKLQKESIIACIELKAYISLAKRRCHLKTRRVKYWNKKTNEILKELKAWHDSDKERYKNI